MRSSFPDERHAFYHHSQTDSRGATVYSFVTIDVHSYGSSTFLVGKQGSSKGGCGPLNVDLWLCFTTVAADWK